jgi:hypothetical protein
LILAATFALAIAAPYLIEHPAAKRIMAWHPPKREKGPLISLEVIEPEDEADAPAQAHEPNPTEQTREEPNFS